MTTRDQEEVIKRNVLVRQLGIEVPGKETKNETKSENVIVIVNGKENASEIAQPPSKINRKILESHPMMRLKCRPNIKKLQLR